MVALAEMGDKTQLLSFLLAGRLRSRWAIVFGILIATLLNHALAGSVGYLLAEWISGDALIWVTGLAFIGFGLWALHPDALLGDLRLRGAGPVVATAIAFFVAEMGDKTQLATVALVARFRAPIEVVLGTTLGMLLANIPAVWLGEKLAQRVSMSAMRLLAAASFLGVGVPTLLTLTRAAK
ncbi:MAG TPA: TMEM165/GDT1 family protein [Burkholderiales bacterium]|nr:TMEM165/GDT1 family protein [Burkholderiales bacterium]